MFLSFLGAVSTVSRVQLAVQIGPSLDIGGSRDSKQRHRCIQRWCPKVR